MYTDQTRVEAYLERDLTDKEMVIFDEVVETISKFINTYTNNSWLTVDTDVDDIEAEERIFDGSGLRELFLTPFSGLVAINVLDGYGNISQTLEDTEYMLLPHNEDVKGSIVLRGGRFPEGIGNISIEAVWGGVVPASVVTVCTTLVANFLEKTGSAGFKKESIEGYSYELGTMGNDDKEILMQLDRYKIIVL